jgi:hypothetical protein
MATSNRPVLATLYDLVIVSRNVRLAPRGLANTEYKVRRLETCLLLATRYHTNVGFQQCCGSALVSVRIRIHPDLDPADYLSSDPDPDLESQTNADPDPVQTLKSQKLNFCMTGNW